MQLPVQFEDTRELFDLEELFTTDARLCNSQRTPKRKKQNLIDDHSAFARTSLVVRPRIIRPLDTCGETGAPSVSSILQKKKKITHTESALRGDHSASAGASPSVRPRVILAGRSAGTCRETGALSESNAHSDLVAHGASAAEVADTCLRSAKHPQKIINSDRKTKPKKQISYNDDSARPRTLSIVRPHVTRPLDTCMETAVSSESSTHDDSGHHVKSSISDEVEEEVTWYCRRCTMGNPPTATACIMCDLRPPSSRKKRALKPPSTPCAAASAYTTTTLSHNKMTHKVKIECRGRYISMSRKKRTIRKRRKVVDPKTPPVASEILIECVICFDALKCMVMQPCSHLCVCQSCAVKLDTCPICRQLVTNKQKIYWT